MSMALNAAVAGMGVVLLPSYMAEKLVLTGKLARMSKRSWRSDKGY